MDIIRKDYPELGRPSGPFCHAVRAGDLLFISGATARDTEAANGTAAQQAEAVLKKLAHILEAEGGTLAKVVKVTVFVTDPDCIGAIAGVRRRYFQEGYPAPTRRGGGFRPGGPQPEGGDRGHCGFVIY